MDAIVLTDLLNMLADPFLTDAVTYGAQSTRGLLDEFDQQTDEAAGNVSDRVITVTVRADALANVANGTAITVAGKNYTVADKQLLGDGRLLRTYLVTA